MSAPLTLFFVIASLAAPNLKDKEPDVRIVVFRHHPGYIEGEAARKAADADEEALLKAAGNVDYGGGLGRGYELSIPASNLRAWKKAVEKLMKDGTLKYYTSWGLDRHGYGLVPVR